MNIVRQAGFVVVAASAAILHTMPVSAQRYSAVRHDEVVTLADRQTDTVVTIEYRATLSDGALVDSTDHCGPVTYLHGNEQIFPELEQAVDGLVAGDAGPVRDHLRAPLADQARLARFLENHDEPRAAAVFPPDRHEAAALPHPPDEPPLRFGRARDRDGADRRDEHERAHEAAVYAISAVVHKVLW